MPSKPCPHCGMIHDDERIEDVRGCRDRLAAMLVELERLTNIFRPKYGSGSITVTKDDRR